MISAQRASALNMTAIDRAYNALTMAASHHAARAASAAHLTMKLWRYLDPAD